MQLGSCALPRGGNGPAHKADSDQAETERRRLTSLSALPSERSGEVELVTNHNENTKNKNHHNNNGGGRRAGVPHGVQERIRAVLRAAGGSVPGNAFPDAFARQHGRPLDYRALGFAKLTDCVCAVPGVQAVPNPAGHGPNSFVLAGGR